MNAFRHGMDSQHLQQATSNPNIQRVLQKQVSLSNKRMSVASSNYNTEAAAAVAKHQAVNQQPQSLPPQLQQAQPQQHQQQVSFPPQPQQQPGIHVAQGVPPHGLQAIPAGPATTRISIPEQSSYSHTETAV